MPEPVSIVHVMGWRSQQFGSFERFLVALCEHGRRVGATTHLVFRERPASVAFTRDVAAEVHVQRAARPPFDPGYARTLRSLLAGVQATHLHAHFGPDAYHALAVPGPWRRFTTKHITPGTARRTAARLRHRWLASRVETVFSVSAEVTERLATLGVPRRKLATVHIGVDPRVYRPDPEQRALVRRELGAGPSTRLVLATSHLRPGKGVESLPRLAAALADRGDVTVLLAGDGPLRAALASAARDLGLTDRQFRLLGVREDVPRLLTAADVFVFPTSGDEGFPLGPLEAVAAGVPLVCTAVSELPRHFTGLATIVPQHDVPALVAGVRAVVADAGPATERAALARQVVLDRFSVQHAAGEHFAHYLQPPPGRPAAAARPTWRR